MFADDFEVPEFQLTRAAVTASECFKVLPAMQALAIGRAAAAAHYGDHAAAEGHRARADYDGLPGPS